MQKAHPSIWIFVNSLKKEIHTAHDLICQINSGMKPREKKTQSKLIEQRIKELYNRFNHQKISVESLLKELSFYVPS